MAYQLVIWYLLSMLFNTDVLDIIGPVVDQWAFISIISGPVADKLVIWYLLLKLMTCISLIIGPVAVQLVN